MIIIRSILKYMFIIYLKNVLDVNILLYKFGQFETTLSEDKLKYKWTERVRGSIKGGK